MNDLQIPKTIESQVNINARVDMLTRKILLAFDKQIFLLTMTVEEVESLIKLLQSRVDILNDATKNA